MEGFSWGKEQGRVEEMSLILSVTLLWKFQVPHVRLSNPEQNISGHWKNFIKKNLVNHLLCFGWENHREKGFELKRDLGHTSFRSHNFLNKGKSYFCLCIIQSEVCTAIGFILAVKNLRCQWAINLSVTPLPHKVMEEGWQKFKKSSCTIKFSAYKKNHL